MARIILRVAGVVLTLAALPAATVVKADDVTAYYCATVQAMNDISRAANQAYGYITGAPTDIDQARQQWVATGYDMAKRRFQDASGQGFDEYEAAAMMNGGGPRVCDLDNYRWKPIPHRG